MAVCAAAGRPVGSRGHAVTNSVQFTRNVRPKKKTKKTLTIFGDITHNTDAQMSCIHNKIANIAILFFSEENMATVYNFF